jgi:hypothetical protein
MQATFEEQINLVNPKVIRALANRRNLFYLDEAGHRAGQPARTGAEGEGGVACERAR